MARLIDPIALIEHPRKTPMWLELRGHDTLSFRVAWTYDEHWHTVSMIGNQTIGYDIDNYNRTWRAWDAEYDGMRPTKEEREATAWLD